MTSSTNDLTFINRTFAISNGKSGRLVQQLASLAQVTCIQTLVKRRVKPCKAFSGLRLLASFTGLEPAKTHDRSQSQRSATHIAVNLVFTESCFVLAKPEAVQPHPNVHHHFPASPK